MCGIVGYIGKKTNVDQVLIDGLKTLEYRGYDSAGIAILEDEVKIIKEVGKVANLEAIVKKENFHEASKGIAHTRWATHGHVDKVNAHPFKVGEVTLVHNGIIENFETLKKDLMSSGYEFKSSTDTEVVAALIDSLIKKHNDISKAICEAEDILIGSYALLIMVDRDIDSLYVVRKDSPLIIGVADDKNVVASDINVILKYTNKYILLDNYENAKLTKDKWTIFDKNGKEMNKKVLTIDMKSEDISKGVYEDYMLKEIEEEPIVLQDNIDVYLKDEETLLKNIPDLTKFKKIFIVACGSAMHAGLVGKHFLEEYADTEVVVEVASEFRYKKNFFSKNDLVILISQSGETADTIAALRLAKAQGVKTMAIVNAINSTIARDSDYVLYTYAKTEIAVATTKAYLLQVVTLLAIALNKGLTSKKLERSFVLEKLKEIKEIPAKINSLLSRMDEYNKVAEEIKDEEDIFFIGRKVDYSLAMEGSLKLKEISYIHSDTYQAGELKHGTISLIENGTKVFAIITDSSIASKTLSNMEEVKARGGKIILITTSELDDEYDFNYEKIVLPKTSEMLSVILAVIPLQLIAYRTAKMRGCNVDQPRNLAKSVTVE